LSDGRLKSCHWEQNQSKYRGGRDMKMLSAISKMMPLRKVLEISRILTSRLEEATIFKRTQMLSIEATGK